MCGGGANNIFVREAYRLEPVSFLMPVVGLLIGWTHFGKHFTVIAFVGVIIVLGGLAIANWPELDANHDRSE